MKKLMLAFVLAPAMSFAADLTLNVHNVKSSQGLISIALCANETCNDNIDNANNPSLPLTIKVPPQVGITTTVVPNLQPGEYSAWFYQDINGNGIADQDFLGRPKEPFGVSQLDHYPLSKPSWSKSKFTVGPAATTFNLLLIDP